MRWTFRRILFSTEIAPDATANMSSYYILQADRDALNCCIEAVPEPLQAKGWRIPKGRRMDHRYPENVSFRMGDHHSGRIVPDIIFNLCRYWMISEKVKGILEESVDTPIEYLPFSLVNHKGRIEEGTFYISNVLEVKDCVDLQQSDFTESKLEPGTFMWLRSLVLDESKLSDDDHLFRVVNIPNIMIVSSHLRTLFDEREVTGATYVGMGEPCMIQ